MRPRALALAVAAPCALAAACAEERAVGPGQLGTFRVLGVRVDPAALDPGATATLTLVTADPIARPVEVVWVTCERLALEYPTGPEDPPRTLSDACVNGRALGAGRTVTVTVPADAPAVDTPQGPQPGIFVAGFACAGGVIRQPSPGGDPWPRCEGEGARGWAFTRTVVAWPARFRVTNPEVASVAVVAPDGRVTSVRPGEVARVPRCTAGAACARYALRFAFTPASRVQWSPALMQEGPTALTAVFYTDRGTLSPSSVLVDPSEEPIAETQWAPPPEPGRARVHVGATNLARAFGSATFDVLVE